MANAPFLVPIVFQGQIVPGVIGEVKYMNGELKMTVNHILSLDSNIRNRISIIPGVNLNPGEGIRVKQVYDNGHGDRFIEYEIYNLPQLPPLQIPPWNENEYYNGEVPFIMGNPVHNGQVPFIMANPAYNPMINPVYSPYTGIAIGDSENVPANATNALNYEPFESGEVLANFQGEAGHGRYYRKGTFNSLVLKGAPKRKENPFTRAPIQPGNVRFYRKEGGAKKKTKAKTKRTKKTKKRGTRRHG